MKMRATSFEVYQSVRRSWGMVNPAQQAFKSKKAYNRKDKSWKKED